MGQTAVKLNRALIGAGGIQCGARIRHMLGAGIALLAQWRQPVHVTLGFFHRQSGARRTRINFAGVKFGQYLAFVDTIPFIHRDRTDHAANFEGEFGLAIRAHNAIGANRIRIRGRLRHRHLYGHPIVYFSHRRRFLPRIDGKTTAGKQANNNQCPPSGSGLVRGKTMHIKSSKIN